jgi:uncharacterized protein (DUF1501 family)
MKTHHSPASRREFLRQAALIASSGAGMFGVNLATIGAAAAQTTTDYKALVCIFLFGGNDCANTVIPYSQAEYNAYSSARLSLAIPRSTLLPITPNAPYTGPELALPAEMSGIKGLFDQGRCAIVANVGPLLAPTSKQQYEQESVPLPPQLFSHSDQTTHWQTSWPDQTPRNGWGGRIGDLLASRNSTPLSISMSVAGNSLFLAGNNVVQYQLTKQGSVRINALNREYEPPEIGKALRALMTEARTHVFENELTKITTRAISADEVVSSALAAVAPIATTFPDTHLANQLKMVARMVSARQRLGFGRQVFFVSLGGFDVHDNVVVDQPRLLKELSDAVTAFYNATVEIGAANAVTAFTASDFGRTLQSNGRGSDHGWGGHHFLVGGAVSGRRVFGAWPQVRLGGPEDAGQGRLVPTTAVDQYAATLASWMGVSSSELSTVVPNIGRFATSNLGFFA